MWESPLSISTLVMITVGDALSRIVTAFRTGRFDAACTVAVSVRDTEPAMLLRATTHWSVPGRVASANVYCTTRVFPIGSPPNVHAYEIAGAGEPATCGCVTPTLYAAPGVTVNVLIVR